MIADHEAILMSRVQYRVHVPPSPELEGSRLRGTEFCLCGKIVWICCNLIKKMSEVVIARAVLLVGKTRLLTIF
jgi:hypothetical protein